MISERDYMEQRPEPPNRVRLTAFLAIFSFFMAATIIGGVIEDLFVLLGALALFVALIAGLIYLFGWLVWWAVRE